jgi:hypothetical protein
MNLSLLPADVRWQYENYQKNSAGEFFDQNFIQTSVNFYKFWNFSKFQQIL